jgi:hypothetical protein
MRGRLGKLFAIWALVIPITGCWPWPVKANLPPESTAPPLPVPPSHMAIPISVPMNLPQDAVNTALPQRLDADDYTVNINGGADDCQNNGVSIGYHVHRDDVVLGGSGNTLVASPSIAYNAGARARPRLGLGACGPPFTASCGRGEPEPHLNVGVSVTVGGVNQDWTPSVTFNPANVSPDGACRVTIFNIHVEDKIADVARNALNESAVSVQSNIVKAVSLPDKAKAAWTLMEKPVKVAPSTWLSIHPQRIGARPFNVKENAISSGLDLQAMPVISYGDVAPAGDNSPLPPPTAVSAADGYFISVPVQADYASVNKQLQDSLKIQTGGIRYPLTGNNYARVTGADVYAFGQKAVVKLMLKVHGILGKRAVLYLVGTPTFDSRTNSISFPDLDFTVDSKNILLKIAAWLEQNKLRDDLRSMAKYDITSYVNEAKQKMLSELNQDIGSASLKGTVNSVSVLGVYTDPNKKRFSAILLTTGSLDVTIR